MRPRIVHIINDLSRGGAEATLLRTAIALAGTFDQTVICLLATGPLEAQFLSAGLRVENMRMSGASGALSGFLRLSRCLRELRPHLVQTWLYHADLIGGMATLVAGKPPVLWNLRSSDLRTDAPLITRLVLRACAALSGILPTAIIACSRSAAESHRQQGYRGTIHIVPNGVDVARFKPSETDRASLRKSLGLPTTAPLVGLVARVHPVKNHALFAEAAGVALAMRPDLRFVLVGPGANASNTSLSSYLARAGVSQATYCLGERNDIERVLSALDLVTLVSKSEGFPNVLAEAVACGVSCVTTDVGAASEIVGPHGAIVEPSAQQIASAWIQALRKEAEAPDLGQLQTARHAHIVENFSQARSAQQYRELYQHSMRMSG